MEEEIKKIEPPTPSSSRDRGVSMPSTQPCPKCGADLYIEGGQIKPA